MPSAKNSIVIDRPITQVFAFVADGEKCTQWRPGVVAIKRVSGDGLGTKYAQTVQGPMGRTIQADYEITAYQPDRVIEFQTTSGPARPHGRYDFEPANGGTRVTFSLDAPMKGLRGLLMGSMVQKTMDSEVGMLSNLKRAIEAS